MLRRDELDREFDQFTVTVGGAQSSYGDARTTSAIGYLGKAVVRLDRTSSRLALVNIVLTVMLAAIGGIQIWLMLKGH